MELAKTSNNLSKRGRVKMAVREGGREGGR
jgi:hypothetical protein